MKNACKPLAWSVRFCASMSRYRRGKIASKREAALYAHQVRGIARDSRRRLPYGGVLAVVEKRIAGHHLQQEIHHRPYLRRIAQILVYRHPDIA